ncbi:MAG: aromatic ring-opening dioxygenase subunit LigB [Armatimonadota bacterium]
MLVFGAIAPHGGDMLEEIADDPSVMAKTRGAMQELGRRFAAARPDTVVVLTPHGMVVEGAISCGATALAGGTLGDAPPRQIQAVFDMDLVLVEKIFAEGVTQQLPLARLVGEDTVDKAVLPMDWGALIPLWYTAHVLEPRPKVVVLAPDRSLPRETLVRCGVAIARAASASGKRVALIASCDQGHAHDSNGPYGYSPASADHDAAMCAAIQDNDLPRLLQWPEEFMEEAKVDAYWQTIILAGALGHTPMQGELLSYEAPTYFGMAVASYAPVSP